jgi:D-glucosaminate-6-phosphate ammonia-lyase
MASIKDVDWGSMYRAIEVEPVINAIGNVSVLGGSTATPEVRAAMERASDSYAPLLQVAESASRAVAEMLEVEAAWITSGAGSALSLAAAACIARDDIDALARIPNTDGLPNEILIQKRQRYSYDRCLELAGGVLKEVAGGRVPEEGEYQPALGPAHKADAESVPGTTAETLARAIGPNTAAVHYVADERARDDTILGFDDILRVTHEHDKPLIVDAAGQVFPTGNLSKYALAGADFVCYGAKYIGAPHSTGFVVGKKEWIDRLKRHSFVAFESLGLRAWGRPHKVDRQEMVGVVAAVREWLTTDHEERFAEYDRRIAKMQNSLESTAGVTTNALRLTVGGSSYGLMLELDPAVIGTGVEELVDDLKSGTPSIWTRVVGGTMLLAVNCLAPGEAETVGDRIASILADRASNAGR